MVGDQEQVDFVRNLEEVDNRQDYMFVVVGEPVPLIIEDQDQHSSIEGNFVEDRHNFIRLAKVAFRYKQFEVVAGEVHNIEVAAVVEQVCNFEGLVV